VIPIPMARRLVAAGLVWQPAPGDRFCIPDRDMDEDVFVLSTMTIEVHDLPGRTVIGFNGTTEWALDDVDKDAALWLPREDQLRRRSATRSAGWSGPGPVARGRDDLGRAGRFRGGRARGRLRRGIAAPAGGRSRRPGLAEMIRTELAVAWTWSRATASATRRPRCW
jgi:hypothetical protein